MSLWDIDKTSNNRGLPSLNVSDEVPVRMSHGTFGITLADDSSDISARVVMRDGHVEVYRADDTLLGRVGVRPSDTEGTVEVAYPGEAL
jgi:hypothetical protein